MNKLMVGAVSAILSVIGLTEAYKLGYNKGVEDCKKTLTFAVEIAKSVEKGES